MMRTYKYKLYTNGLSNLDTCVDIAAEIWDYCIALHKAYYKHYHKHLSANKLKVHLTKVKKRKKYEHWKLLGSQAIQDVVERIDRSYKAFFDFIKAKKANPKLKGHKSPPGFKHKRKYKSFTLKQAGYQFTGGNHVTIMGHNYKFCNHRPMNGTIKTLTVKRTPLGEFFIYVVCEVEEALVPTRTGKAVGMDFGLKTFLTLDNGNKIRSPEWYKRSLKEVQKAHRKVSLCKKGSKNRKRAVLYLNRCMEKIAHQRRDWFYKLANELCREYATICIEDLNLEAMKRLWGRKISDLAFAEFVSILEYTATKYGTSVIKIDRWYPSSKTCHVCGTVKSDLNLKTRQWTCSYCGTSHDRDINAAINIKTAALNP